MIFYLNNGAIFSTNNRREFKITLTEDKKIKFSKENLSNDFDLLYYRKSKESRNKFIAKYVDNTDINGNVIIIKHNNGDLELNTHKWIGRKILKKCDWLGFTLE